MAIIGKHFSIIICRCIAQTYYKDLPHSEAGTYVALYDKVDSDKAEELLRIINGLVDNPDKIYSFLKAYGEAIEWD